MTRRAGLGWMLGYSFLLVSALGLTLVTRPQLTVDIVCYVKHGPPVDSNACRHDAGVQQQTARVQMLARLIGGLLSVATTAYWSGLSDRCGRTRLLAVCQLGWIANEALFLALVTWPGLARTWVLVLGPAIDGALGGLPAMSAITSAYMSDVAPKDALLRSLTLINGTLAVGAALSPSFATLLIRWTHDAVTPLRVAIVIHALLLLYCLVVLPESKRKPSAQGSDRTLGQAVLHPFKLLTTNRNLALVAVVVLVVTQMNGLNDPLVQYLMYAVGWDQQQIGPAFSLISGARTFVLMAVIPGITMFLRPRLSSTTGDVESSESTPLLPDSAEQKATSFDHALLLVSLLIKCGGELLLGLNARASGAVYVAGSLVLALSSAANPCAGVLALELVDEDKHGELFGALGVVEAISTTVIGPVFYTFVFVMTIDWYPAFMFLVASATAAVAALLTTRIRFS